MGPRGDLLCRGGRLPLLGRTVPTAAVTATSPDRDDRGQRHTDGRPRQETVRDAAGRRAQNLQARGPAATTGAVAGRCRSVEPGGEAGGPVFVTEVSSDQEITPVLAGQTCGTVELVETALGEAHHRGKHPFRILTGVRDQLIEAV